MPHPRLNSKDWEQRFDKMALDLCIAFIPDGDGDEVNLYLSEAYNLDKIKGFIRRELRRAMKEY